jgi:hypothetical protein
MSKLALALAKKARPLADDYTMPCNEFSPATSLAALLIARHVFSRLWGLCHFMKDDFHRHSGK